MSENKNGRPGLFMRIVKFEKILGKADPLAAAKRVRNTARVAGVLAILLIILIIIMLHLRSCGVGFPHGSVDIPGNIIDPVGPQGRPKAEISFGSLSADEDFEFGIDKMIGGDSESVLFHVVVEHNSDFVLKYDMTIRDDESFEKLAEVLKIKVELVGENGDTVLYNGLLRDMHTLELELLADELTTTDCMFRVTVYLDESLKEEYYGQSLIADMSWWIDGHDRVTIANCEFTTHPSVSPPGPDGPDNPPGPDDPDDPDDPDGDGFELSFVKLEEGDNSAFDMENLVDNVSQTKYFAFEVSGDEDVKILIDSDTVIDSKLANVLFVKVELVGENGNVTLYEGLLKDLAAEHIVDLNSGGKTTVYYKVTVTVDGLNSLYANEKFSCDLSWSLDGTSEQLKIPNNSFEAYESSGSGSSDHPDTPTPPTPPTPPQTATSIKLNSKDGYDNVPFSSGNMLPGEACEQYYCISVTHSTPQTVRFSVYVDTSQKLSKVLRIKVEQLIPNAKDEVLYDGLMKDCTEVDVSLTSNSSAVSDIYYRITVYTNGAEITNEYAGEGLDADFSWRLQ